MAEDILYVGFDKNMERRLFHMRGTAERHVIGEIVEYVRRTPALSHAAGQEVVIPEGWTLVPKVPTQQMIDCGNDVADWGFHMQSETPRDPGDGDAHEVYHAMLLAAPLVPAARSEGGGVALIQASATTKIRTARRSRLKPLAHGRTSRRHSDAEAAR